METNSEGTVKVKEETADCHTGEITDFELHQIIKREPNFEECLLLDPFVNHSSFNVKGEIVKNEETCETEILNIKQEPSYYSSIKCKQEISDEKSFHEELCYDTFNSDENLPNIQEYFENTDADEKIDILDVHLGPGDCNEEFELEHKKDSEKQRTFAPESICDGDLLKQFGKDLKNKIHKCHICCYRAKVKSNLTRHIDRVHNEHRTKLNCELCDKSFATRNTLNDHILNKHKEHINLIKSKIHTCSACSYQTTNKYCLKKHTDSIHNNLKIKINCQYCDKSFIIKRSLNEHLLRDHKQEIKSKIHYCNICSFHTTMKQCLDRHIKSIHEDIPIYNCQFCGKSFLRKLSLNDHLLKQHKEQTSLIESEIYKCSFCSYQTLIESYLKKHINLNHKEQRTEKKCNELCIQDDNTLKLEKEKKSEVDTNISNRIEQGIKNNCEYCSKSFIRKEALNNHLLKHHSMKSEFHKCNLCSFETAYKSYLREHHTLMHTKQKTKINCNFCDKSFRKKPSFDNHLLTDHKHEIKNMKDFITSKIHTCKMCSFQTTIVTFLNAHINAHHNKETKITCQFCDKAFEVKRSLDNHLQKHHKEDIMKSDKHLISSTLFTCNVCFYTTTHKGNLNSHINSVHNAEREKVNCTFCDKLFLKKQSLHNHLLKLHKKEIEHDLAKVITSKIFQCKNCTYETVFKNNLNNHKCNSQSNNT